MKQLGTYRIKVTSGIDKKKLSNGIKKEYKYGSITIRASDLSKYIGKVLMVRVFEEDKK